MNEHLHFHRSGRFEAFDWGVHCEVNLQNCYRLPEKFEPEDTIIDVGAFIGYFTDACLRRGAGKVVAFEAHPANFARAVQNLGFYGERAELHLNAVWRSDVDPRLPLTIRMLGFNDAEENINAGGNTVAVRADYDNAELPSVRTVGLDSVLKKFKAVRFLKLDCEGSEYPIIYTSKLLPRCQSIAIEVHPVPLREEAETRNPNNASGLAHCLNKHGFKCTVVEMHSNGWSYIFAERETE